MIFDYNPITGLQYISYADIPILKLDFDQAPEFDVNKWIKFLKEQKLMLIDSTPKVESIELEPLITTNHITSFVWDDRGGE